MNEMFSNINPKDIIRNLINLPQLVYEVTDICNLRCKYCGFGDLYEGYDPRNKGRLSLRKAFNILDYLAKLWKENIQGSIKQPFILGFYGGEPLLAMNLIKEIIEYAQSLDIKSKSIHYNLTTNGLLLNKHIDYLVKKEFNLLISLDGDEKDHSYRLDQRGRNSHKRVIDNIQLIQHKYPEYFHKHVNFNTVLHNMNTVESAHRYIKKMFGKATKISPLNNSRIRMDKINEFIKMLENVDHSIEKTENCNELESELFLEAPKIRKLITFLYTFSGNIFDDYGSLFFDLKRIKPYPTGTCVPFLKKMYITVSGKILQCEKIKHEFALGQVYDDKIELNFDHIAEISNNYILKFTNQCKSCLSYRTCTQCAYQIDEIINPAPKCRSYINQAKFQQKIDLNLDYLSKNPHLFLKIMKEVVIKN